MGLFSKWIEIFRVGDFGDKGKYTRADLEEIAANYDPNLHEAPIVLGHPASDSPAYGWVEALRVNGDVLEGKLKQIDSDFENAVRAGRFKKRSVALYKTLDGRGLYLRHLGFLGAQPPELKGLKPAFHDDDLSEYVEIEEDGSAPKTVSELEMLMRVNAASKAAREVSERQFAQMQARVEAEAKRKEEIRALTESLKVLLQRYPAFATPGLVEFTESLPDVEYIEFGEGENKQIKSPREIFTNFLETLPWFLCGRRPPARKV